MGKNLCFLLTFLIRVQNSVFFTRFIKYNCRVILTNGSRKILAADMDKFFEVDIQPVKAVNTTGYGDAFTAGLAAALEDGANFKDAIAEGVRYGALNATLIRPGVVR